jgi:dihydroorotase
MSSGRQKKIEGLKCQPFSVVTHSNNGHGDILNKDFQLILQCMTEAMMIRDELGSDIDINKLGVTLFLRKIKA